MSVCLGVYMDSYSLNTHTLVPSSHRNVLIYICFWYTSGSPRAPVGRPSGAKGRSKGARRPPKVITKQFKI